MFLLLSVGLPWSFWRCVTDIRQAGWTRFLMIRGISFIYMFHKIKKDKQV